MPSRCAARGAPVSDGHHSLQEVDELDGVRAVGKVKVHALQQSTASVLAAGESRAVPWNGEGATHGRALAAQPESHITHPGSPPRTSCISPHAWSPPSSNPNPFYTPPRNPIYTPPPLTSCISLMLTHASSAPCFRISCSRKKKVRLCATCCRTCVHIDGQTHTGKRGSAAQQLEEECVLCCRAARAAAVKRRAPPVSKWQAAAAAAAAAGSSGSTAVDAGSRGPPSACLHARHPRVGVCVLAVAGGAHVPLHHVLHHKRLQQGRGEDGAI